MLVRRNGGSPPLTYQSFCKLVGNVGNPPPPAADPPAAMPAPRPGSAGLGVEKDICAPTWQEVGFKEAPVTIFKARQRPSHSALHVLERF